MCQVVGARPFAFILTLQFRFAAGGVVVANSTGLRDDLRGEESYGQKESTIEGTVEND